ncbi:MAG TPA: hypothetical protein VGE35_03960 [Candidatus Paceibacterota bacterium]
MRLEVDNVAGDNPQRGIRVTADTPAEADLLVSHIGSGTTDPEWAKNNLVYSALVKALGILDWKKPFIQRQGTVIVIRQAVLAELSADA